MSRDYVYPRELLDLDILITELVRQSDSDDEGDE